MTIFDAPERNTCTVHRQSTNTPMQALVLLNDPQYVEAARFMAERMLKAGGDKLADQIKLGFRLATGVRPSGAELDVFAKLYTEELEKFQQDPAAAREWLSVGEAPRDTRLDLAPAAAMAVVASTILNHDAAYMKR
jgi:hypothetical protein